MKGLSLYPEDGAFQKFYGDFLRSSQGIEQAISYYMQAQNLTRNGFLLLEIAVKLLEGSVFGIE